MRRVVIMTWMLFSFNQQSGAQSDATPAADLAGLSKQDISGVRKVERLLQLSEYFFSKSKNQPSYQDSSLIHAAAAETLSSKLGYQKGLGNSYEQMSKIFHKRNDIASGKYFANKAIEIFKKNNYLIELGYAYFDLSGYYSLATNDLPYRIELTKQSLHAFQRAGNTKKEADVLKELGDLYQIAGDYEKAITQLRQALKIYQAINYPNLHGTYDLMGAVFADRGDYEQALQYGLLAVKTAELVKDTTLQIATIYNRVAITYEELKKNDKAYEFWQKGLLVAKRHNDMETIIILSFHIAKVLVQLNKPYESLAILKEITREYNIKDNYMQMLVTSCFLTVYRKLDQYETAQQYCYQLLRISGRFDKYASNQSAVYEEVIPFFISSRQDVLAKKYLAINEAYCRLLHWPIGLSRNHLWWFRLDSAQGNYKSAIFHYQQYKAIGDSLLGEATRNRIEQFNIQYETEKKDQDIILKAQNIQLLTKQSQLQLANLQTEKNTRNMVLICTGFLFLLLTLGFNRYKLKQKNNQQLEQQQKDIKEKNIHLQHLLEEKEWLVKEIHHRVKNNFHTVIGLLGTQAGYLRNEEAISAMAESQQRIQAMSLIHQKLYQSESMSDIDMSDYIHELVDYLKDSLNTGRRIQFHFRLDRIHLGVYHAVPIGLILNETITNAIKYAFPENRNGNIHISFTTGPDDDNNLLLVIKDDGAGLPVGFDSNSNRTMGMNLINGLAKDIDGQFTICSTAGTIVKIAFAHHRDIPKDHNTNINEIHQS